MCRGVRLSCASIAECKCVCQIIKLSGKIGIKYQRKGNNSVILNDKNAKKLHKLHTATTNLNTHLCILIYNGFAIIPDLRQTGIAKNLATFGKKII